MRELFYNKMPHKLKAYRNEWKYCISTAEAEELYIRLYDLMERDPHADAGGVYDVHSLYFDSLNNICAKENIAGERRRFKYRIRFYGDESDPLFLERKSKINSLCHKEFCSISVPEYDRLVVGDYDDFLWERDRKVLERFALDMAMGAYGPKSVVSYERQALIESVTNVRITFDRNIVVSDDVDRFLTGDYSGVPVLDSNLVILEVKYDDILPSYIRRAIQASAMVQQAFSKYYHSRVRFSEYKRMV